MAKKVFFKIGAFFVVIFSGLLLSSIYARKVEAVVCMVDGYCPEGYTETGIGGCITGKYDNQSWTVNDCKNKKRGGAKYSYINDASLVYNFESRKITSNSIYYEYSNYDCRSQNFLSGPTYFSARPDIDLSTCLPDFSTQRITSFSIAYHDNNLGADFVFNNICFRTGDGGIECHQDSVSHNFDLVTCTIIKAYITYDPNATSITWSKSSERTGCPGDIYVAAGCHNCHDGADCDFGECEDGFSAHSSRVESAFLTVPEGYKLYSVENTFLKEGAKTSSRVWEIVAIEYESEESGGTPPEVVSVDPPSGWSGTVEDEIPQAVCDDENPATFTMQYRDSDGCNDIENAFFWIDNASPDVFQLHSSVHGGVRKDASGNWTEMWGIGCNPSGTNCCDAGGNGVDCSTPGALSGCNCWQNYNWTVPASNTIPSTSASLCSPRSASAHTDYNNVTNCANTPAEWTVTNVTCKNDGGVVDWANGDNLFVEWKVWFKDDSIVSTGDVLDIYGWANDSTGQQTGWIDVGDRQLDFDPPGGEVTTSLYGTDQLKISWLVNDSLSGIRTIDRDCGTVFTDDYPECGCSGDDCYSGRDTWTRLNDDGSTQADEPDVISNPGATWGVRHNVDTIGGISEAGVLRFKADMTDNACNANEATKAQSLGVDWTRTDWGDVYSYGGFGVHIPDLGTSDPEDNMSKYICSTNSDAANFSPGGASYFGYVIRDYEDTNTSKEGGSPGYYDYLYGIVSANDAGDDSWSMTNFADWNNIATGANGVFLWTGGGPLNLSSGSDCDFNGVIFVPDELVITPDFGGSIAANSSYGCLFITQGDITITSSTGVGSSVHEKSGETVNYDSIYGFFITDGTFSVDTDTDLDQVQIKGGVISESVDLNRRLDLVDNLLFASEVIEYDARYLYLLKDYLSNNYAYKIRELRYSKAE